MCVGVCVLKVQELRLVLISDGDCQKDVISYDLNSCLLVSLLTPETEKCFFVFCVSLLSETVELVICVGGTL